MTSPTSGAAVDLPEITREEIERRRWDPSLTVVNVLPKESFESGRIPGSVNLPLAEVETRARTLLPDAEREIAVYCASPT
jgi:ArsR family transcriptional regulator